jgi:hypothetical protein
MKNYKYKKDEKCPVTGCIIRGILCFVDCAEWSNFSKDSIQCKKLNKALKKRKEVPFYPPRAESEKPYITKKCKVSNVDTSGFKVKSKIYMYPDQSSRSCLYIGEIHSGDTAIILPNNSYHKCHNDCIDKVLVTSRDGGEWDFLCPNDCCKKKDEVNTTGCPKCGGKIEICSEGYYCANKCGFECTY